MMNLIDSVTAYLQSPYPLWSAEVSIALLKHKWHDLNLAPEEYTTAWSIAKVEHREARKHVSNNVYYEPPSFDLLNGFYDEHGLDIWTDQECVANDGINKLRQALKTLDLVRPAYQDVCRFVRAIQLVRQPDPEIDISYSHPEVPFSIFVSLCEDTSSISNLRVAESILHEAMHLKLSLIESVVPLVKPFDGNLYFSPWRDEKRPAQGVLHGMYVFRTIRDYYSQLLANGGMNDSQIENHLKERMEEIERELNSLREFEQAQDLTPCGVKLIMNLRDYNILE